MNDVDTCPSCKVEAGWIGRPDSAYCTNPWHGGVSRIRQDEGLLAAMVEEVMQCNIEKGWYDESRTFGDDIALLHSEVSEALEAFREGVIGTMFKHSGGLSNQPEIGGVLGKPVGVASELADVLVRLLDTCRRYDIDLFREWRRKMDYNWQRPTRHGGKRL